MLGPHAEGSARGDPLADLKLIDAGAERIYDADGLGSGQGRQVGLEAVGAAYGPEIMVVDG